MFFFEIQFEKIANRNANMEKKRKLNKKNRKIKIITIKHGTCMWPEHANSIL